MGAKSSECSRQTLTGTSSSGDQSDVSSSHDSPAADHDVFQRLQGSTSTHATETMQPLRDPSPKGSLRKSTASRVQVKHKPRNQGQDIPEQHEKSQIEAPPDADDASHLSQDIGMSTHSSGTARIDKDNF
ncbi:hypothetical protein NUU61_004684 [Penicillium alfredii]|uniref:Uncharacterized protein n=1 Tax=Penicillium alfredii TaxID=1506179 RepID=A0A9W9F819_9EURO|nr:uncharacterized protein NUU61_004684 [Penicillium alfredii]KAJ5095328.1 hypothetical protein NUU61_004684 [Penicillium alfredii]